MLFLWFMRKSSKQGKIPRRGAKGTEITRAAVQKIGSTGQARSHQDKHEIPNERTAAQKHAKKSKHADARQKRENDISIAKQHPTAPMAI